MSEPPDGADRLRLSFVCGADHFFRRDVSSSVAGKRRRVGVGLEAAALPAGALQPIRLHRHMPEGVGEEMCAAVQTTPGIAARSDAGSQRYTNEIPHAASEPEVPLANRQGIGIILHDDWQPGDGPDFRGDPSSRPSR